MASVHSSDTRVKHPDQYKEKNLDRNTPLRDKVLDLVDFVVDLKFGMMTTRMKDSELLVSRCMAEVAREDGVDFIFFTNTETGKTDDLVSDPHVNLGFLRSSTGEWASISGIADIDNHSERVKQYYTPLLKAWVGDLGDKIHDGGPEDPRLGVIKVHARTATYLINEGTIISRGVEMVRVPDGNAARKARLRELTEEDLNTFRSSLKLIP